MNVTTRIARVPGGHDGTGVNSPVLFAPKPGTTELRFCFDCRVLNKALADYPTPLYEDSRAVICMAENGESEEGNSPKLTFSGKVTPKS